MNELIVALVLIFPLVLFLLFFILSYWHREKAKVLLFNEKLAPFLFVLYFLLLTAFHFPPFRTFLEWIGVSQVLAIIILITAIVDNFVLFLNTRHRSQLVEIYSRYLKTDIPEFALVLLFSFLTSVLVFFRIRNFYQYSQVLSILTFIAILCYLPFLLYHYRHQEFRLNLNIKLEYFLAVVAKFILAVTSPVIFIKLLNIFFVYATTSEKVILVIILFLELLFFVILKKKIVSIPEFISQAPVFVLMRKKASESGKSLLFFIYTHLEIAAVLFLLLVVSWPIVMSQIEEYKNWRSNFPIIKKATPIIGMQGTMIILTGENFGTTGEGLPGKVIVGDRELMTPEWNDHKIVAVIPVPPPHGILVIKKNFKWKAKAYIAISNKITFSYFDWTKASPKEIDKFLDVLKRQYR